jgi:hypothetical protein
MPHPDEGLIHAWLDGELDSTDAARVEELVARDPVWAAAAAEARGLIAASSRIAGALDRVPGNVIPRAKPKRRQQRWWMTRVAALLLVAVGVVTVVRRPTVKFLEPAGVSTVPAAPSPAVPAAKSPALALPPAAAPLRAAPPPIAAEARTPATSHAAATPATGLKLSPAPAAPVLVEVPGRLDRDQAKVADELAGSRRKESAMGAAGAMAKAEKDQTVVQVQARALLPAAQNAAKAAALPLRCFESRQPTDSAKRILRLSVAALADSVRLGALLERGDSLFDRSRRIVALSVRCPEP